MAAKPVPLSRSRTPVRVSFEFFPPKTAEMEANLWEAAKRLEPFALRALTDAEKALADSALLDPERPEDIFEPISRGRIRGLFRRGGFLRRPH